MAVNGKAQIGMILGFSVAFIQIERATGSETVKQPNFLIIMGDDCTYSDLPVYGGKNVKTPNIDRLASQGIVFNNAFLSMSMCVPCRAELFTGRYPFSNGVCWNHVVAKPEIKGIGQYLKPLGYRVGLAGKTHVNPLSVYQFEMVEGVERNCTSKTAAFEEGEITKFISRNKNQPFCLTVAFTMPHCPWTVGDPSHFNPEALILPDHIADTKESRSDFCKYLAEIEELDKQTGKLLDLLEKSGEAENIVVLFTSEQGAQWPGCKWTNWNSGVHTGFFVKWPGVISAQKRTDALIQYCDVLPTLLELAGDQTEHREFDGKSFVPVLTGETPKHRDYAFFMHNNIPEGPSYPIRAVSDGTWHYIRNLLPENIYIEKHVMGQMSWHQYWPSWVFEAINNEHTNFLVSRYMRRPPEELYNSATDPANFQNLISNDKYKGVKKQLSEALDRWLKDQKDPGALMDTWEFQKAAAQGKHKN